MFRRSCSATLALLVSAIAGTAQDAGVPSKDGLVVCASAPACDAGAAILAKGGNALDAAVATSFALAVTYPAAGNIGGGGFMIVRTSAGEVTPFDYRDMTSGRRDGRETRTRSGLLRTGHLTA